MSLAPASIRGFFLKARFAVNGIQNAERSFGIAVDDFLTGAAMFIFAGLAARGEGGIAFVCSLSVPVVPAKAGTHNPGASCSAQTDQAQELLTVGRLISAA